MEEEQDLRRRLWWSKVAEGCGSNFRRFHSLAPPDEGRRVLILLQDNPSKDFYFPITALEAQQALGKLPSGDVTGITHIWCRRIDRKDNSGSTLPLAQFIAGSGVRAIVLYPWARNGILTVQKITHNRLLNEMRRHGFSVARKRGAWSVSATEVQLQAFYIQSLIYHEVGHHVDWYIRRWSAANEKQTEDAADDYAQGKGQAAKDALADIKEFRSWEV